MPGTGRDLLVLWGWLLLVSPGAGAVQIDNLQVQRAGRDYRVSFTAVLRVPLRRVWQVLTDYGHLTALAPAIEESEILRELNPAAHRVRIRERLCVLIFCKQLTQVQIFRQHSPWELEVELDPEASDFEFGQAHWRLEGGPTTTRLRFDARLRPAFWVPPVIGPWAIKRVLRKQVATVCAGLERLAARVED